MHSKDIILQNYREYLEMADYAYAKKKFNAAVTLYYKALVELCDLMLFEKTGKTGANHNDRFHKLSQYTPELYRIASDLFAYYRDSYDTTISHTTAAQVKDYVNKATAMVFPK